MNAPDQHVAAVDRRKFIGGIQSNRVAGLNEGVVRHMYENGMTQAEIADALSTSQRSVCLFMRRCGIQPRVAAKRDQSGEKNSSWKGELVKYKPAHNRVYAARGRPQRCEHCGKDDPAARYDWANLTGKYHDPNDYIRLCRSCHNKHDGLIKNLGAYAKEKRHGTAS